MRKALRFLQMIFYYRFIIIPSCSEAKKRGLTFEENVYGDGINLFNCRSFWADEFGFVYRCAELYDPGLAGPQL